MTKIISLIIFSVLSMYAHAQTRFYHRSELDVQPIYSDSITFARHIQETYEFPAIYETSIDINVIVLFVIDEVGEIKWIDFPRYYQAADLCYGNVLKILKTAQKFTPGKKDGKPVCTIISMQIPYSDKFINNKSINIEF